MPTGPDLIAEGTALRHAWDVVFFVGGTALALTEHFVDLLPALVAYASGWYILRLPPR